MTCEENYDSYYGDNQYDSNNNPTKVASYYGWDKFYDYPPEHYGWVVEIDPKEGKSSKHIVAGKICTRMLYIISIR